MKYKALTVARECGSGGGKIAGHLAGKLGWKLLDKDLLAEISNRAQVSLGQANDLDERIDPWVRRITRPLWGKTGDGTAAFVPVDLFDADQEASVVRQIIEEAYSTGDCVIVGRGSQCILQARDDVFHAFVYAPWRERLQRAQKLVAPGTDVNAFLQDTDNQRLQYVRHHYGQNWLDPHLYDLMISSHNCLEMTAQLILQAMDAVQ